MHCTLHHTILYDTLPITKWLVNTIISYEKKIYFNGLVIRIVYTDNRIIKNSEDLWVDIYVI